MIDYTEAWIAKLETYCTCCIGQGHITGKQCVLTPLWEYLNCHLVVVFPQDVGQKLNQKQMCS